MDARITYRKGPLGYAVLLDGKPVGSIKDRRQHGGWQVSVPGLRATDAPFAGRTVFPKIADAKAAVVAALAGR